MMFFIVLICFCIPRIVHSLDPACDTTNHINDWKRSAAYGIEKDDVEICDSFLPEGWYKITSKAGDKMPTSCLNGGFSCCTSAPLWLSNENVKKGENVYPNPNDIVDRIACAAHFDGDCCKQKVPIKIKNCGGHYVYYLTQPKGCNTAYCFGDKKPCPPGESSETGFPPGCGTYPNETVKPLVKTGINIQHVTNGGYNGKIKYTYETVQFECAAPTLNHKYTCIVRWYINDFPIESATKKDVQVDKLNSALLLQEHWEKKFKPNMNVKCSIQLKEAGFTSPGPEQYSDNFMAGLLVTQTEFAVDEGGSVTVPVKLTIPLGCSYPTDISITKIRRIKENSCVLVLATGVPKYQTKPDLCQGGINKDALSFEAKRCGISFTNVKWNEIQNVVVHGAVDNMVNYEDRIAVVRLYNDVNKTGTTEPKLKFWSGVVLKDIKFRIKDKDDKLLGNTCSSNNDPHISTFEGKYFSFHKSEGEYLLYRNTKIPVEVHAYYRKCNGGALCNCGAAIRSGDSAFVVNFCVVKGHKNSYVTQKICGDHQIDVKENGNTYEVITMSGTVVIINLGQVYHFFGINSFVIKASAVDRDSSEGLCGSVNGKDYDDLLPRGTNTPFTQRVKWGIIEELGKSWKIVDQKDSLFNIYAITPAEYRLQTYCTCNKYTKFPFGNPDINCELKSALNLCKQRVVPKSFYTAQCTNLKLRTRRKRSVKTGQEVQKLVLDDDDAPEMFLMDVTDGETSTVDTNWKNGWTDQKARDFCTKHLTSAESFAVCNAHVPSVPSEKFINECVEDIKIAGDTSWLDVSVSNFGSECFHEAIKIENLTRTNSTDGKSDTGNLFAIIAEATCPKNCSERGFCKKGVCKCLKGYFGPACERKQNEAPELYEDSFDGLCDISSKPCKKYVIPGLNFMDGNLTCKYRYFNIRLNETIETGAIEFVGGEYTSIFAMKCPAPISRHKRSVDTKQSAFGYFISVSNDGKNFTDELAIIIYDSSCFECNTSSLTCEEVTTCPKLKPVTEDNSHTAMYIGTGLGGAATVIFVLVILYFVKRKILRGRTTVKDSTLSLPNKVDNHANMFVHSKLEKK